MPACIISMCGVWTRITLSLEAHVVVPDMLVSGTGALNDAITEVLDKEFKIGHTVIQFESDTECGENCLL